MISSTTYLHCFAICALADTKNLTEQTHTGSALSERLHQTSPRGPFQLQLLYDSVNKVQSTMFPSPFVLKRQREDFSSIAQKWSICLSDQLLWIAVGQNSWSGGSKRSKRQARNCWILETEELKESKTKQVFKYKVNWFQISAETFLLQEPKERRFFSHSATCREQQTRGRVGRGRKTQLNMWQIFWL